jgi:hypothetical protein
VKNEMGRACSTDGEEGGVYEDLVRKPEVGDTGVDGRIILRWTFRK